MNKNAKDLVNQLLQFEPDTPLESVQAEINQLADEVLCKEQLTVKSVQQEKHNMTQWTNIHERQTRKPATIEDVQEMFSEQIYLLSELLGIELED